LTPPVDEHRDETVKAICALYKEAPSLAEQGEQTVSTDKLTGVQALERKHLGLPLAPGKVERREFEYVRHGTRSFILSRHVVTGKLLTPAVDPPGQRLISWHTCKRWSRPIKRPCAGTSSVTS
jgi:hypothetical protein